MTHRKVEVYVTCNDEQRLYVVDHGDHIATLGYDVCADRTQRILIELVGRLVVDEKWLDEMPDVNVGTRAAWDLYVMVVDMLKEACDKADEQAVYDLSPQLTGLEGYRVEVVDNEGDRPRRFIVGRSTGWAPCHLEMRAINSLGGDVAKREYRHVRQIERVR